MILRATDTSVSRTLSGPQQPSAPEIPTSPDPQESFVPGNQSFLGQYGPTLAAGALGAGLGILAGSATGVVPALAGLAAGTGFGVVAAAGTARAGFAEASGAAGAAGLLGGAVASAYVGYAHSSPVAAIALGTVGALGFSFYQAMSSAMSNWK